MVATKGKPNKILNRVTADNSTNKNAGLRNFKVYAENEKRVEGRQSVHPEWKRKSNLVDKGKIQINATDSKGCLTNLEKNKGKHGCSTNIGRKALADVSNVRGNFSRNEAHDDVKIVKPKSERITSLQRLSMDPGTRTADSTSSKPSVGKVIANITQAAGNNNSLRRGSKVASNDQRSRYQGHEFVATDCRTTGGNILPLARRSLPVLKGNNQADKNGVKENAEISGKDKGKYGFPVKPKVGRKVVVPQSSNGRSNLWNNRVSDGFMITASKVQPKVNAQTLSRKSAKPIVKTTSTISNTRRTIKSKCTSRKNELTSAAISYKRTEEVATSLSENIASIVEHEGHSQGEFPSDNNSNLSKNAADVSARRKSERRKSYTSLLMARSKLIEDGGGVMKQENLPCIYDDHNHLEAAEYVDDIYQYYWVMEAQSQSLADYMKIQTAITPQMRGILVNWLIEVHLKFDLMQETLYLMVTLLDQYLSLATIKKNEMQLVGLTALLLASKYEDFWHPRVTDLISISAELYTKDQMLVMEKAILKKLKFRLNAPTPYVFMLRFLKAAQSDAKLEHLAFYLVELCLVEYEALKFKPSLLCASAIYVARYTLQTTPAWTPLLGKHTHYEESQIRECAEMILRFHRAAGTAMLKVSYEKYKKPDYSGVTAIKPLHRLPPSVD